VHLDLCTGPESKWNDVETLWDAIPAIEMKAAIQRVTNECIPKFGDKATEKAFQVGIEQSLYQTRRTWQQGQRRRAKQQNLPTGPGAGKDAPGRALAADDLPATAESRPKPFDPVRD
jgi:hypothetical protein